MELARNVAEVATSGCGENHWHQARLVEQAVPLSQLAFPSSGAFGEGGRAAGSEETKGDPHPPSLPSRAWTRHGLLPAAAITATGLNRQLFPLLPQGTTQKERETKEGEGV